MTKAYFSLRVNVVEMRSVKVEKIATWRLSESSPAYEKLERSCREENTNHVTFEEKVVGNRAATGNLLLQYTMRSILIILSTLFLSSCSTNSFDKDYYERITGIKFPDKYRVLQTFDNGEFMTGTVFQLDSISLQRFIVKNHFDPLQDRQSFTLPSRAFLDIQFHPDVSSDNSFFIIRKSKDKNNWIYLADLTTNRLWTEMSYPDWSGQ